MNYFATFKENGDISGFYVDTIHGESIPANAMKITEDQWKLFSVNANLYKLDGDTVRPKTQEERDAELAALPPAPPSLADRIAYLEELELLRMLGEG